MSLLPLLFACAADPEGASAAETPIVTFVSPSDGEAIQQGSVSVSIAVNHFVLVDVSKHSEGGAEGVIRFTSQQGSVMDTFDTGSTTFTIPLTPGEAELTADLRYADGDELIGEFPDFTPATVLVTVE